MPTAATPKAATWLAWPAIEGSGLRNLGVRAKAQELRRISHMRQSTVAIIIRHSSGAHTTIGSDEGSDLRSRISNS